MSLRQDGIDLLAEQEAELRYSSARTSRSTEVRRHAADASSRRRMADDLEVVRELRRMESLSAEPDTLRIMYLRAREHLEREGQRMLDRLHPRV